MFAQVVDLTGAERAASLDALGCGGAERALVEDLLRHHDAAPAFLDAEATPSRSRPSGFRPTRLGPYRVLELLGQGGMGMVFLAQQDRPSRRVALKVLPPAIVRSDSHRRFVQEAELLGRLQHAGIAQVYDAGVHPSEAGEVACYAMEWVDGPSLTAFCRERGLDTRARCALLAQVCDAVQHAHERGVLHRDLKPANILVASASDGQAQPKVLDFGIARALDGEPHATRLTHTGQLIGTLAYMSPEQVRGTGEVDARADVYALGVILYELLTSRLPVDVDGLSLAEAARRIGEEETTRLSRQMPQLRGELDTILATALAKEPARRYQSAKALGADLRRFLRHEPITAQPATALYRLSKFVRRHRGLVFGALATFVALSVGLVATTMLAMDKASLLTRETAARRQADANLYRAEMLLAGAALQEPAGWASARELLGHWQPRDAGDDLRRIEWYLLASFGHECVATLPAPLRVENCAWHPRRPWLAVAGHTEVRVVDLETRRELFANSYGRHVDVEWSADGALLLVGATTAFEVLRASNFEPLCRVELVGRRGASAMAWSPDASRVAVTFFDRSLAVYDWRTGTELATRADVVSSRGFGFSPDGTRIALPCGKRADVVDAVSLAPLFSTHPGPDLVACVAWRPDGAELASAHTDGAVLLCSASDGRDRARLAMPTRHAGVERLAWDASGERLAATFSDFAVAVWELAAPHTARVLSGHRAPALGLAFGPRGELATGCALGELRVWDLTPLAARRSLLAAPRSGRWKSLRWHPDGHRLAVNHNTSCRWVDTALGVRQPVTDLPGGQGGWSPDGACFLYERERCAVVRDGDGRERTVGANADQWIAWDPSRPGAVILLRTRPRDMLVLDVQSGQPLLEVPLGKVVLSPPAFSRDGTRIALLFDGGEFEVRSLATGGLLGTRTLPGVRTTEAAFCPQGRQLAVACWDGRLRVFAADGSGDVLEFGANSRLVLGVSWHPTEPRLASAGEDRVCRIWDADAGVQVATFPCVSELEAVSWRPDGKLLAVARRDGVVEMWDATVGYAKQAGR